MFARIISPDKYLYIQDKLFFRGFHMKKLLGIVLVIVLIGSGLFATADSIDQSTPLTMEKSASFSKPKMVQKGDYLELSLDEAPNTVSSPGFPALPRYTETLLFPLGTTIDDIELSTADACDLTLSGEIIPVPQPQPVSSEDETSQIYLKNPDVYEGEQPFPKEQFSYTLSAGIQGREHFLFVTIQYYPVVYIPYDRILQYTPEVTFTISYRPPKTTLSTDASQDLLIIAPEEYVAPLEPLVTHKTSHDIRTIVKTVETISAEYQGRDIEEQIKYCIKDAVDTMGVTYVLLVGSVYKVPMRASNAGWHFVSSVITDLYYADLYDANNSFSSWDSNHNDVFGEEEDHVDLHPDVHIGRLACDSIKEVNVVVDKIIHYEEETFGEEWFNKMIYIGGDTFPRFWGWLSGREGEVNNKLIMDIMTDFEPSHIIWTSKGNFNRKTISQAINEGAGFLDYSGHGYEHGMGTYRPRGRILRNYFTFYIKDLVNGYKLPVMFFDACLTAKLDFTLQDLLDYKVYRIFKIFTVLPNVDPSKKLPCFAWSFVSHEEGGAIATIGATRTAFGGVTSGAGKMSIEFFEAYQPGVFLGDMMTQAQHSYINDVPSDTFTVEEFTLLGDPTLKIGGYSHDVQPPEVQILNPKEGYFHVLGVPLVEIPIPFDFMYGTMALGGFRKQPLEFYVTDDTDIPEDLTVTIQINEVDEGTAHLNPLTSHFEWTWTGLGFNVYTLRVTAEDRSGNVGFDELPVWYFCLLP
jgi:hypothetical protein